MTREECTTYVIELADYMLEELGVDYRPSKVSKMRGAQQREVNGCHQLTFGADFVEEVFLKGLVNVGSTPKGAWPMYKAPCGPEALYELVVHEIAHVKQVELVGVYDKPHSSTWYKSYREVKQLFPFEEMV